MEKNPKNQEEIEKKIRETAELIKNLAKSDPSSSEEFDKLLKSDPSLEDLRK